MSPGIKADNIYAVFHLFASEVPRFRIPGSRFRFRELPPAIKVVTDRYKVPGSGSITQRGTLTGAKPIAISRVTIRTFSAIFLFFGGRVALAWLARFKALFVRKLNSYLETLTGRGAPTRQEQLTMRTLARKGP